MTMATTNSLPDDENDGMDASREDEGDEIALMQQQKGAWHVFCEGPLLEAVQSAWLFPDCKTFVDMPLKKSGKMVCYAMSKAPTERLFLKKMDELKDGKPASAEALDKTPHRLWADYADRGNRTWNCPRQIFLNLRMACWGLRAKPILPLLMDSLMQLASRLDGTANRKGQDRQLVPFAQVTHNKEFKWASEYHVQSYGGRLYAVAVKGQELHGNRVLFDPAVIDDVSCTCGFRKRWDIPCRHVIAVAKYLPGNNSWTLDIVHEGFRLGRYRAAAADPRYRIIPPMWDELSSNTNHLPPERDPIEVFTAFQGMTEEARQDPDELLAFVDEYFSEAGSDILPWLPPDFVEEPPFLQAIEDDRRRTWARQMHSLWAFLVRRVAIDVWEKPQRHSLIYREHPVVVPGGRFRESYYWDSFWIVRGLLVSGMGDTAMGVVMNLLNDVDRFGFVPNGGRIYYAERSQPPLLPDMVCDVYSARRDAAFLVRAIPSLEAEHAFWMNFERGRAVCVPARPFSPPTPTISSASSSSSVSSASSPWTRQQRIAAESGAVLLNRYWGALDPPPEVDDASGDNPPGVPEVGRSLPSRPPRPESFREDMDIANGRGSYSKRRGPGNDADEGVRQEGRQEDAVNIGPSGVYHELAAAAESGWDFSSRWESPRSRRIAHDDTQEGGANGKGIGDEERALESDERVGQDSEGRFCLGKIKTTSVVPVDLNAFMHRMEINLARLHQAQDLLRAAGASGASGVAAAGEGYPYPLAGGVANESSSSAGGMPRLKLPPPLMTIDEIQWHYLTRERNHLSKPSNSSSSSVFTSASDTAAVTSAVPSTADGADAMPANKSAEAAEGGWVSSEMRPGNTEKLCPKARLYMAAARARSRAIERTMWDDGAALWRDVLLPTGEQSPSVTPACFVPMWASLPWPRLREEEEKECAGARLSRCVTALRRSGLVQPGGVCTSLKDTGEQWDGRNAWPPLQWLLIQGLRRSADAVLAARTQRALHMVALSPAGNSPRSASTPTGIRSPSPIGTPKAGSCSPSASNPAISGSDSQGPTSAPVRETADEAATAALGLAAQLEEAFLSGALAGWEQSGKMMEKYDAKSVGKGGSGGEYELQIGFGWTNGVALDLLAGQSKRATRDGNQEVLE